MSAYKQYNIIANDKILFYVKQYINNTRGFIACAIAKSNMKINDKKIKINNDTNLNKYYFEIVQLKKIEKPKMMSTFSKILNDNDTNIHKLSKLFVGEYVFINIEYNIGNQIFDLLCEFSDNDNEDNELVQTNNKLVNNDEKINGDILYDNKNDDITNDDIMNDNMLFEMRNNKINEEMVIDDDIINNIPILMLSCRDLRISFKNEKNNDDKKINRIKHIMNHYNFCDKCEITNNNKMELNYALNNIGINNVELYINGKYEQVFDAYINCKIRKPKNKNEYIKIHYMRNNEDYKCDILIEFATNIVKYNIN